MARPSTTGHKDTSNKTSTKGSPLRRDTHRKNVYPHQRLILLHGRTRKCIEAEQGNGACERGLWLKIPVPVLARREIRSSLPRARFSYANEM